MSFAAYGVHALQCIVNGDDAVPLIFDLDIQTRPSEGPNTSTLWILRKSVQRFPRDLSHKQKVTDTTKNRTLLACGNYLQSTVGLTKYCWTLVSRYDVYLSKKSVRNRLRIVLLILKCKNRVKQFSDFVHIKALDPERYWKHLAVGNDEWLISLTALWCFAVSAS